jgi:hypothetical protein
VDGAMSKLPCGLRERVRRQTAVKDRTKALETALEENDFALVRGKKHRVYRNPEGKTLVMAATPSDRRADANALTELRHLLNATPEPTTEASDAEIPKQEKRRAGASQPANIFNFYEGFAPRSVPATPEATIRALRGYLQSKQSYNFKSAFQKEITRLYRHYESLRIHLHEACVRDFAEMWPMVVKANQTETQIDCASLPDDQAQQWRVFHNNLNFAVEQILERDGDRDAIPVKLLGRVTLAQLQLEIRLSKKNEIAKCAALANLFGRVANHLLRGESAARLRVFIAPKINAIQDRFDFEFRFDFMELIEEIAAEKIETIEP